MEAVYGSGVALFAFTFQPDKILMLCIIFEVFIFCFAAVTVLGIFLAAKQEQKDIEAERQIA